MIVMTETDTI